MNKFKTNINGGLPFTLDDLRWMDAAYREAFLGFWKAFATDTKDGFILAGCAMADQSVGTTVNEGWICLNGEICYVPEHTIPAGSATAHWDFDLSYDSTGLKTFADSTTNDTYEVRVAKVNKDAFTINSKFLASNTTTLHDLIVKQSPRQTIVQEIGIWDMTAAQTKTVTLDNPINTANYRVLSEDVFVFEDSDITARLSPNKFDNYLRKSSILGFDGTNLLLSFDSSSGYNSASYNNASDSRGYVVITYEPIDTNYY
jgi:hypothetical protein